MLQAYALYAADAPYARRLREKETATKSLIHRLGDSVDDASVHTVDAGISAVRRSFMECF